MDVADVKKTGLRGFDIKKGIIFLALLIVIGTANAVVNVTECMLLDQPGETYILQNDITYDGTCFAVDGDDITLDLNGHTVRFYNPDPLDYSFGVICHPSFSPPGRPGSWQGGGEDFHLTNGHIIQASKDTKHADTDYGTMSNCVYARSCHNIEISDMEFTANSQYDATIIRLRSSSDVVVHDVKINNNVKNITNRHWPGQSSLLLEAGSGNCDINNVEIIGGPHKGMSISGTYDNCNVHDNTISHDQSYVNGYAFALGGNNIEVHHNTVVPTKGRGVHITGDSIKFHHNYMDLKLGMVTDHYGADDYHNILTNVHGVKFEGGTNSRVYANTVIATQPSEEWAPPTPLNIDTQDTDANNEIFNNNFTAITFAETSGGNSGYGAYDEYATGPYFYRCTGNNPGRIHHNLFYSNDRGFWKDGYSCSNYKLYNNRFIRLDDYTSNSRSILFDRSSGYVNFTDNEFVGFASDDVVGYNGAGLDMLFLLAIMVIDSNEDPVADAAVQVQDADSNTVFDGMTNTEGEIKLYLPMYVLTDTTVTAHQPYTITYDSRNIEVDFVRSMYVTIDPIGEEFFTKCSHGSVAEECLCSEMQVDSDYCCFDTPSTTVCESFEVETCVDLGGAYCDRSSNTCDGGAFMFSIDEGMDCCTGTCTEIVIEDPCDEADTDEPYGEISLSEINDYISQWFSGSVNLEQVMDAIGKWKDGCE